MRSERPNAEPVMKTAARLLSITFVAAVIAGRCLPADTASAAPIVSTIAPNTSVAARDGQWSTATLSDGRVDPVVATVGTKVLFAGGCRNGCESPHSWDPSSAVDLYDGATDQWSSYTLSDRRSQFAVA